MKNATASPISLHLGVSCLGIPSRFRIDARSNSDVEVDLGLPFHLCHWVGYLARTRPAKCGEPCPGQQRLRSWCIGLKGFPTRTNEKTPTQAKALEGQVAVR